VSSSTTMGSRPFFKELPRKMSAISVLMTARNAVVQSAQGACSREEPQPKLRPVTSTWQPARFGRFKHELGLGEPSPIAPIGEQLLAEAFLGGGRQKRAGMI
jgi:hypothetical protein